MSQEQRIFRNAPLFVVFAVACVFHFSNATAAEFRVKIADDSLSFVLPSGWIETDLNAGDVLAGYATQDNRSSVFFKRIETAIGGSMQDLMDGTIFNFEQRFKVTDDGEVKTGQVKGPGEKKWPAIFTTLEAEVVAGTEKFEMKFYVLLFDTGSRIYTVQASTTKPVREARERQVYELIRSIVAKS
jgi:hypothetical protein